MYVINEPEEIYNKIDQWAGAAVSSDDMPGDNPEEFELEIQTDETCKICKGSGFNTAAEIIVMEMIVHAPEEFKKAAARVCLGVDNI